MSMWHLTHRADPRAAQIADRHYNRQKVGSPQFVPPGRCMVLLTEKADALWITSFPFAQYVRHEWAGAWVCSCFRRQPEPVLGMITFVDATKVRSTHPGYCYKQAGFQQVGRTKGGLIALQQLPARMPMAASPGLVQQALWEVSA